MSRKIDIPFFDCYMLTVDEASVYFHIGGRKMRELIDVHKGAKWMLYNGNRIMIKKNLFVCMNIKKVFNDWNQDYYYNVVHTGPGRKASDCIKCGKCEKACPQHLKIRELLVKVAETFEH